MIDVPDGSRSLRFLMRSGRLARLPREAEDGGPDVREPEDLFKPITVTRRPAGKRAVSRNEFGT